MVGDLHVDRALTCSPAIAKLFSGADLVVGNFEASSVDADSVRTTFANMEIDPGRCVLSLANSSAGNGDAHRLHTTVDRLYSLGVNPVGAIRSSASPLTVVDANGVRVGIAAWTHWLDRDVFAEGEGVATPEQVLHRDWLEVKKEQQIDCLIGAPHWEWATQFIPRQDTVAIAQHLAESGFDMIGGHHPGVVQPLEWFSGPDARTGICQFSLGGIGTTADDWAKRLGIILEAELISDGEHRGQVASYTLHPVATVATADGARVVPLRYAPHEVRERMWRRIALLFDEARYPAQESAPPMPMLRAAES